VSSPRPCEPKTGAGYRIAPSAAGAAAAIVTPMAVERTLANQRLGRRPRWCFVAMLSGCSTSLWYTAVQGAAYERRESIQDADERARCKSANCADEEKDEKERAPTRTR